MAYKSEYGGVIFEKKNHIAYITFNTPKTLNALSGAVFRSLNELFDEMSVDNDVRGVVLTGTGKSFVSGADLSDPIFQNETSPIASRNNRTYVHSTFNKVANFDRPTVAAINGYALGGGAELALCCDFRIVSTKAKIGFPEPRLGAIPGFEGPTRAVRIMGITNAKKMLYTGAHFTAQEALELGYATELAEPDALMERVDTLMGLIAAQAPLAVKYSKIAADRSLEMSLESALEYERMLSTHLVTTHDYHEGHDAFFEKRPPVFKGE